MQQPPTIITEADLPKCTAYADTRKHPIPIAWHLMLDAGLRLGETLQLSWGDVIHLDQPKSLLELTAAMTKNNRARSIPIGKLLHDAILSALQQRPKDDAWSPAMYLISRKCNGPPLSDRTLQRAVESIGRTAAGISITPHSLRHTFATRLAKVCSIRVVQATLGHSRVTTTEIYTHVNNDDVSQAIRKLDPPS
jgi:integrase